MPSLPYRNLPGTCTNRHRGWLRDRSCMPQPLCSLLSNRIHHRPLPPDRSSPLNHWCTRALPHRRTHYPHRYHRVRQTCKCNSHRNTLRCCIPMASRTNRPGKCTNRHRGWLRGRSCMPQPLCSLLSNRIHHHPLPPDRSSKLKHWCTLRFPHRRKFRPHRNR